MESDIKNTLSYILTPQDRKYLDIELIKYVQDPYEKNYKALMKDIKEEWTN